MNHFDPCPGIEVERRDSATSRFSMLCLLQGGRCFGACILGLGLGLALAASGCSRDPGAPSGWKRHPLPGGFVMDTPEGWRVVSPDGQAGRVRASGPAGEQVVIWPLSLPGTDLAPAAANQLVARLARVIEPGVAWNAVQPAVPGYVRVVSRGGAREGVTVMAWQKAAGGTAACVYSLLAGRGAYGAAAGVFEKIASSFRLEAAAGASVPRPAKPPAGVSRFVM